MSQTRFLAAALLAAATALPAHAELQGSVFTYQGKLEQSGVAVDGARDLRFRLFDADSAGVQVGADVTLPAQAVVDGVFSVPLDFGLLAFNGEARWLEIAVDGITLAPRQLVTNAPYALFALDGAADSPIYTAGAGITITGGEIAANIGTGPGTVAAGDGVILNQYTIAQGADFWISGRARAAELRAEAYGTTSAPLHLLRLRGDPPSGGPLRDRFRVDTAGGLVAIGDLGHGTIPASGAGERMAWHPYKVAFRAGGVDAAQWDDASTGFYSVAFGNNTTASAFSAFAMGDGSSATGTHAVAFGSHNIASGTASFTTGASSTCSGFTCVAMGFTNTATGQGSVAIGYRVTADGDYSTALGHRAASGGFMGSFIWGDQSGTTVHTNTANNQFMVRASGGVNLRTSATLATGCNLPAGSGVFTCTSDRNAKHDFAAIDAEETLLRVTALPVQRWRYISEPGTVHHVGPTAQDFRAAFGLGVDDVTIGLADIDGINMLAIQALAQRTDALAEKTREIADLRQRLDAAEAAIAQIRARLGE